MNTLSRLKLLAISDVTRFGRDRSIERFTALARAAAPGTIAIDLREPSLPLRELMELAEQLHAAASANDQLFVMHDRLDCAALFGADAVHLGELAIPSAGARTLLGDVPLIRACHAPAAVSEVDADYVLLSPILAPRKQNPALGLPALRQARALLDQHAPERRLIALGGVDAESAAHCLHSGADVIAAIGGVFEPNDPGPLVDALGIERTRAAAQEAHREPPFVHASAEVEPGAELAAGVKVWRGAHVMSGARLGQGVMLGQGCFVGAGVRVGSGTRVQNHVDVYEGVALDQDVFVGPGATFTNVLRPRAQFSRRGEYVTTRVRRGATVGARATIIAGVTIGRYALVGAGAVVTRDVADHSQVTGVPARHSGWVSRRGEPLVFRDGRARCPTSGESYRLLAGRVVCDGREPHPSDT